MSSATPRQRFMLFCLTKDKSYYDLIMTIDEASNLIGKLKTEQRETKVNKSARFRQIWDEAHTAGISALEACKPIPMIVEQHRNMIDDNSPVERQWFVGDGVCGFAWVNIPANTEFGRWLKQTNKVKSVSYGGGYSISCMEGGQSLQRKEHYCRAFARVLVKYNITCNVGSRMD